VALGYRQTRSHQVVEPEECPILAPDLEAAVVALSRIVAIVPRAPRGRYELHLGEEGLALCVHAERGEAGPGARWLGRVLEDLPRVTACELVSPDGIRYVLAEGRVTRGGLAYSPGVFAQGHGALAPRLAAAVADLAKPAHQAILELHAGAGLFTVELCRAARRVVAVEESARACEDARRNLESAGLRAEVHAGAAASVLARLVAARERFDVVVLDPPRTGAAEVLPALADLAPRRIVYVSCDPLTLARDLQDLGARGYLPRALKAFDLFPQTYHLEAACLLERAGQASPLDR
jgi:23S rRNA (uracil1939-C5)-methyltransferase